MLLKKDLVKDVAWTGSNTLGMRHHADLSCQEI